MQSPLVTLPLALIWSAWDLDVDILFSYDNSYPPYTNFARGRCLTYIDTEGPGELLGQDGDGTGSIWRTVFGAILSGRQGHRMSSADL